MKLMDNLIMASEKGSIESIRLNENITLTSLGLLKYMVAKIEFFSSGFCIEYKGKRIYIDPVTANENERADYIFITHPHPDHLSLSNIKKIADEKTIIVCPKKALKKLKDFNPKLIKPGESIELEDMSCMAVPAYSIGFPTHPKKAENVGYVLELEGIKIYHAGDTDLVDDLKELKGIDTALVPIDGGNLTMKTEEAAELINQIKPRLAVPMHYEIDKNKAKEFAKLIDEDIEAKILID